MTFTIILYYLTETGVKRIYCNDCYDFHMEMKCFCFTREIDGKLRIYNPDKIKSLSIILNRY